MFVAVDNTVVLPGFTRADAAVFYTINEHWRVQANVENLFDKRYIINADSNTNLSPGQLSRRQTRPRRPVLEAKSGGCLKRRPFSHLIRISKVGSEGPGIPPVDRCFHAYSRRKAYNI